LPLPGTPIWDMVKPEISDDDFFKLNFFGGDLVDKYNRSEVRNLEKMRVRMSNYLYFSSRVRKIVSYVTFISILIRKNRRYIFSRIKIDIKYEYSLLKSQVIFSLKTIKPLRLIAIKLKSLMRFKQ
jgi:hypothetical protein